MRQLNFRDNLVFLFLILVSFSYGQKTPKELGRSVFGCIKSHLPNCVNTYLPTQKEYKTIVKALYLHSNLKSDSEMTREYLNDISLFKSMLRQILTDSLQLKIDWGKAKLKRVETKNFFIPTDITDTGQSNRITITEVKIIFSANTIDYVLFLPSVWNYKRIWKLGNQILYGKADFKYGTEFKF